MTKDEIIEGTLKALLESREELKRRITGLGLIDELYPCPKDTPNVEKAE